MSSHLYNYKIYYSTTPYIQDPYPYIMHNLLLIIHIHTFKQNNSHSNRMFIGSRSSNQPIVKWKTSSHTKLIEGPTALAR